MQGKIKSNISLKRVKNFMDFKNARKARVK